ncbi:MAG: hypothetical protein ACLR0U_12750 [Enterocloster clostridioformis]
MGLLREPEDSATFWGECRSKAECVNLFETCVLTGQTHGLEDCPCDGRSSPATDREITPYEGLESWAS